MQTAFTDAQRADPQTANSEAVIRRCVHCGFCTATCPTYVELGDERDSPRGRIYLLKEMLERQAAPTPEVVRHIDRCLSCLACETTCPSDVRYRELVDHGRAYIEANYRRPWPDRAWRWALARVLPHPARLRVALALGRLARPLAPVFDRISALKPGAALLRLTPARPAEAAEQVQAPAPRGRVVLLRGCVEPAIAPRVRAAAIRLLNRAGFEVVEAEGEGCCGGLVHHMGREAEAHAAFAANTRAWRRALDDGAVAVLTTVSGCGAVMKDYGFHLRADPALAADAGRVSAAVRDIVEFLDEAGLPPPAPGGRPSVAYHAACSLQHGQKIAAAPRRLLVQTGFEVREIPEGHLCCGSAGTYNILQSELAERLRRRKQANIEATAAEVVAAGNIGCITQIGLGAGRPVLHTVELLDWATGGPPPPPFDDQERT